SEIAAELEKSQDVNNDAHKTCSRIAAEHKRIIFNGDNYTEQWSQEAKKRGLPNMPSTVEALGSIMDEENVKVFEKHKVLSRQELAARTEILVEAYSMRINIEALTMLNMASRQILPAAVNYSAGLAESVNAIRTAGADPSVQKEMLEEVCDLIASLKSGIKNLQISVEKASKANGFEQAKIYRDSVKEAMADVRSAADQLEMIVDADLWPLPSYAEMLFIK
ncbi:MAG: glutamine synthetase type III, partial [Planctomycetes bacterium]|nr:glutamine synthetase type III [Planctomycetota bacterium]